MIEETTLAIIFSVLAPIITIIMAKMKSQTTFFKAKIKNVMEISKEIDDIMKDNIVTPEEARRLVSLMRTALR